MDLTNINKNFNDDEKNTKNYFIIDIDNLDWLNIIYIYAKILSNYLETITDIKEELELKNLVRINYSSSKSGVHIKVNIKNNFKENLYLRSYFNDDINRVKMDIIRANNNEVGFTYDVSFKYKSNKLISNSKNFEIINYKYILNKINMKKNTFYKLIKYIKLKNMLKINLVLSGHKKIETELDFNDLSVSQKLNNPNLKCLDYGDDLLNEFKAILNKYSNKDTKSLTKNYHTTLPIELCKSVYRLAREKN